MAKRRGLRGFFKKAVRAIPAVAITRAVAKAVSRRRGDGGEGVDEAIPFEPVVRAAQIAEPVLRAALTTFAPEFATAPEIIASAFTDEGFEEDEIDEDDEDFEDEEG